jgi:hypothetical protein
VNPVPDPLLRKRKKKTKKERKEAMRINSAENL